MQFSKMSNNKLLVLMVLVSYTTQLQALCYSREKMTLAKEFASSDFVLTGTPITITDLSSPDDPAGVEATLYKISVTGQLKGQLPAQITLRSANTSSRVVLVPEQEYLLFVHGPADNGFVDNCGHSGLLSERQAVVAQLKGFSNR